MLIDTKKMIPITKLQKELMQKIRELSINHEPIYIMKNNNMEAVMVSFDDYEYLKNLEEILEHFEIDDMIKNRMKNYNPKNNIAWKNIKE